MKRSGNKTHNAPTKVNPQPPHPPMTLAQKLEMLNPNAAGLDAASEERGVCVPEDRAENNVRRFGAFPQDLDVSAAWLTAWGAPPWRWNPRAFTGFPCSRFRKRRASRCVWSMPES